ncbi:diguanylate cyclase [Spirulina subsalsa FACHB-351]|uniref:Diguanylate cyclase n=1 Tax=Spirulina subsalsa FACHB-351 TaxID=234711 RepID=A0ABT3L640_9CYAN|nr:diguanylate cyclase [Spirulina subsalsa]MCW6036964.1 diguanylate cyclase [Spirulina subsalsa FACHB-351]
MQNAESSRQAQSLWKLRQVTVQEIRALLDADRVNLLAFQPDGVGVVVSEAIARPNYAPDCRAARPVLPSLLNLHFPAADIPSTSRVRFLESRLGVQVNTITQEAVYFHLNPKRRESVHPPITADPCHVEYLGHLGVQFSLTIPVIISQGVVVPSSLAWAEQECLWGLVIVHYVTPPPESPHEKLPQLELYIERLQRFLTREQTIRHQHRAQQEESLLMEIRQLLIHGGETDCWQVVLEKVVKALGGCGGCLTWYGYLEGIQPQCYILGDYPLEAHEVVQQTWQNLLDTAPLEAVTVPLHFPALSIDLLSPAAPDVLKTAFQNTSTRLLLGVGLQSGYEYVGHLSIFRRGRDRQIYWAGNPERPQGERQPRFAFDPWLETETQAVDFWLEEDYQFIKRVAEQIYTALRQQQIEHLRVSQRGYHALTQLPNRQFLSEKLAIALINSNLNHELVAVIFIDLDRFKQVNKVLGHRVGDELLCLVAQRLKEHIAPPKNLLAHWSGDKFVGLLRQIKQAESEAIETLCQDISQEFQEPFYLSGQTIYVTLSMGVALAPYDGTNPETLLLHAEAAMYNAKQQGRNTYQFYRAALGDRLNPLSLEADLRSALINNHFQLYYQPQIDLKTGKVMAMEALIRWHHPQRGLVSPCHFIPLAEESSLICDLGVWVLHEACLQYKVWESLGMEHLRIAVNVSARQFQQVDFLNTITGILADTETPPSAIEIEITEGTAAKDVELTTTILQYLQNLGVTVALDDFGTGYSSLNAIKHFPLNTLKVDQSFVRDVITDPTDAAIVKTVAALGHGLKLQVLAEGVETLQQLEFLQSINCDLIQGYLFSPPLSSSAATEFLQNCANGASLQYRFNAHNTGEDDLISTHPALQDLLKQAQREHLTAQIAQQIHSSLKLEDILNTTVREIRHFLGTDRVILYQFKPNWDGQVVVESVGPGWKSLLGQSINDPCFRVKCAPLYRRNRISAISDVEHSPLEPCYRQMLRRYEVQGNLVVSIVRKEELWGLLIAHHCSGPREWLNSEIDLLRQLASQVAIAIYQSQLYQQLEQANQELRQIATQDSLTGVANRRALDDYILEVWGHLQQEQAPLSLILCDIDHFKYYNDTYGHQAGDHCLKQVAGAMQHVVENPRHLVARYGGEEFAIILPHITHTEALEIATHLQQHLHSLKIPHISSPISPFVTLSIGVTTHVPRAEKSQDILIAEADQALYRAKAQGRNCIESITH